MDKCAALRESETGILLFREEVKVVSDCLESEIPKRQERRMSLWEG